MEPVDVVDDLEDDTLADLDAHAVKNFVYDLDLIEAGWRQH
jgi:hypothetical protein